MLFCYSKYILLLYKKGDKGRFVMIKYLDGMHETPDYRDNTHLVVFKNNNMEDYPPHWHFPIEFTMPIKNSYTIIADDKEYVVNPYEILYIGSGVIHSTIAPDSGERYFFQIDISRLKSIGGINNILSFMGPVAHFTSKNNPDIQDELVKLFKEICQEYFRNNEFYNDDMPDNFNQMLSNSSLSEPIIYSKLLNMLTLIGRNHLEHVDTESTNNIKRKEYIDKFMAVCRYIDEHFAEDLNLDDVAAMAGFSKFHFSRLFKQFTNISFYKYVNQQRISYAEQLLVNPDISVTQVAIQSGFSSSSSFIRMFKQFKNCTPTDFRSIQQQKSFSNNHSIPQTIQQEIAARG